jgi:hypothetical protein
MYQTTAPAPGAHSRYARARGHTVLPTRLRCALLMTPRRCLPSISSSLGGPSHYPLTAWSL